MHPLTTTHRCGLTRWLEQAHARARPRRVLTGWRPHSPNTDMQIGKLQTGDRGGMGAAGDVKGGFGGVRDSIWRREGVISG